MQTYSHPEILIDTAWVASHQGDPNVRIVESDEDYLLHETGHLPGAVKVDWFTTLQDSILGILAFSLVETNKILRIMERSLACRTGLILSSTSNKSLGIKQPLIHHPRRLAGDCRDHHPARLRPIHHRGGHPAGRYRHAMGHRKTACFLTVRAAGPGNRHPKGCSRPGTGRARTPGSALRNPQEDQPDPLFHRDLARAELQSLVRREIRAWGAAPVLLGVVHLVTAGPLNTPWGIALILVGLASFYFSTPAMFIVYRLTLAWAAATNAFTGDILWLVFTAFQLVLAVVVFLRFQRFKVAQSTGAGNEPDEEPGTAMIETGSQAFTLAGLLLGAVSLMGFIAIFLVVLASLRAGTLDQGRPVLAFFEGLAVNLGVLGFAAGLASLLSRFPRRSLAILSKVAGGIVVLTELVLTLLRI